MAKRHKYKKMSLGDKKTLAKKMGFTLLMITLFKVLGFIPAPFVNTSLITEVSKGLGLLQTAQLFSGNAFTQLTLMATGVSSYITASIVIQFLTYAFQGLHDLSRGANGEKVMKRLTMALGLVLSLVTSLVLTGVFASQNPGTLTNTSWYARLIIAAVHAFGTFIAISIGNAIEEKGYGNGVSLLIAVNVVSSFPAIFSGLVALFGQNPLAVVAIVVLAIVMILLIITVDSSEKRIAVNYTKSIARSHGHHQMQKQRLPLKVNASGVMPIILAATILQVLTFVLGFIKNDFSANLISLLTNPSNIWYVVIVSVLIVLFTFFYSTIVFDAGQLSDNLLKNGGAILGIRPGKDTKNYLKKVNNQLTKVSALYLLVVSLIPAIMILAFGFAGIQATSLMIIVGVSLEVIIKLSNEYNLGKMKL